MRYSVGGTVHALLKFTCQGLMSWDIEKAKSSRRIFCIDGWHYKANELHLPGFGVKVVPLLGWLLGD
ncbi:hypothetical protein LOAG_06340 [Loa loa]|uniref:Uncharacterized protein n=1 Tax=Loa loa TaxID=7209 RepID=A0A1S0TYA1_LOALO|nr:hypothetical protein LOAG_06340 [Loa loa]EFO22145.1 hypothetical protein LOAG_06340 [Loa loa]